MPLSPSETTALLNTLGHLPKKKLGQNFLIDGNIVEKSLQLADLPASGNVVEIGPGLGTLTRKLLDAGQTVHSVEIDYRLAENIEKTETEAINQVRVAWCRPNRQLLETYGCSSADRASNVKCLHFPTGMVAHLR